MMSPGRAAQAARSGCFTFARRSNGGTWVRIQGSYGVSFAVAHGLENEARTIRSMRVHPRAKAKTGYTPRKGAFVDLFENRGVMNEFMDQYWPAGRTPEGQQRRGAYLESKAANEALLAGEGDVEDAGLAAGDDEAPSDAELAAFAMEGQLRDFIVENISRIPIEGETLKLYCNAEGRDGREFPRDVGPIDILAVNDASDFFVFELKLGRGPDRALGQLARYMAG
jgi:hypothetical protein